MSQLSKQDRETLLQIARDSVRAQLSGQNMGSDSSDPISPPLAECRGVFVSIHHGIELRGCVGRIDPKNPLYKNVSDCAIAAATEDPRFPPLQLSELPDVEFEISVLSPIQEVTDLSNIQVGVHGLIVSRGNARGLLLPQVAVQYQWSLEQFLGETCRKAGLPPTAWKQGATVQCFTAEVFP
jgi:AmmeMemoRadiSam system protein A